MRDSFVATINGPAQSRAKEATAGTEYEIVVAGPIGPDWLIKLRGREYVLSANANAYPVRELARVAPLFRGRPVYHKHTGDEARVRTRLLLGRDGEKTRVGHLVESRWHPKQREIRATLKVTSPHWQEQFNNPWDRWQWGFSMDVDVWPVRKAGVDFAKKIAAVFSVDLEPNPAMGGRFADALRMNEADLAETEEHFEYMRQLRMEGTT